MHLIIVLAIVLLIFGPKRLPELSKGLGQAIRGFKRSLHEEPDSDAKKIVEKEKEL
jgi:sec-independent protein translocase protein TatA